jgi:Uncharacterized conserved protein (some members contain a von Willebrand factor type A (vWA) domain)
MLIFLISIFVIILMVTIPVVKRVYYKLKLSAVMTLEYDRKFSVTGAFEDEEVYLIETVYNRSFIPMFFVDIEFYLYNDLATDGYEMSSDYVSYLRNSSSAMQMVLSRFHLMPFMKIVRQHRITCRKRGFYQLDAIGIQCNDIPVYKPSEAEIYIYPKITDIQYDSKPFNVSQGNVISLSKIITDPFLISGIRDYQSGDSFNMINFKATAKAMVTNSIKVNKLDYSSSRTFMIYINFQKISETTMPSKVYEPVMEKALSYSASFINDALKNGYRVGLSANCMTTSGDMKIEFPQVSGLYHIEEILKEISRARTISGASFGSLLNHAIANNVRDSEIYIMSLYIDGEIEERIRMLRRLNNYVHIIKLGE